jgi:hypothetical protein
LPRNENLAYLFRPIQTGSTIELTASVRVHPGNGNVDLLSINGSPSGIIVTADANGFMLQTPKPDGSGTNDIAAVEWLLDAFTRVKLTVDRKTHKATLDSGSGFVSMDIDPNFSPTEVRVGFFYGEGISQPWQMQVDDIQLINQP